MNNQHGVVKTKVECPETKGRKVCLIFKTPLNMTEHVQIYEVLNQSIVEAHPYNFFKLIILAFVYPTRKFWNWINWVPFQAECFGFVCSAYIDWVCKEIDRDLLICENEEYTVPGDIIDSPLLEVI